MSTRLTWAELRVEGLARAAARNAVCFIAWQRLGRGSAINVQQRLEEQVGRGAAGRERSLSTARHRGCRARREWGRPVPIQPAFEKLRCALAPAGVSGAAGVLLRLPRTCCWRQPCHCEQASTVSGLLLGAALPHIHGTCVQKQHACLLHARGAAASCLLTLPRPPARICSNQCCALVAGPRGFLRAGPPDASCQRGPAWQDCGLASCQ